MHFCVLFLIHQARMISMEMANHPQGAVDYLTHLYRDLIATVCVCSSLCWSFLGIASGACWSLQPLLDTLQLPSNCASK